MKKIREIFKKNVKLVIGIIIGAVVSGGTVYAATVLAASQVSYTKNSQSTVDGALDTLFTRANTWINPSYIDFTTLATNSKKTILASKNGICIKRNNKVSCFKINNWAEEQNHIQQVFSDISCSVNSSSVYCYASDFGCGVFSNGRVRCNVGGSSVYCYVNSDGSVNCP